MGKLLLPLLIAGWAAAAVHVAVAESPDVVGTAWAAAWNNGLPPAEAHRLVETIRCESRFNPSARGDRGNSIGLAQLWRYGDEMPRFYAMGYDDPWDAEQAADFMAREFANGRQRKWSAYPGNCP